MTHRAFIAACRLFVGVACLALTFLLAGCGGGSGGSGDSSVDNPPATAGRLVFRVQWPDRSRLVPLAANSVWVFVNGSDPNSLPAVGQALIARPDSGGVSSVTFDNLQPGFVTIEATAFPNRDGTGTKQGVSIFPATLTGGKITTVNADVISAVTQMEVSVSQSLAPGQTLQAGFTAFNSDKAVVLIEAKTVQWTSSDSSVARVDATGIITGVATGKAIITARDKESGTTGMATLLVRGLPAPDSVFACVQSLRQYNNIIELREYMPSGDVVRAIPIPQPDKTVQNIPPLITNHDGKIYALMGSSNTYLSIYDPIANIWSTRPLPTVTREYSNRLAPMASLSNYIFVLDATPPAPPGVSGGHAGTVVRYDLTTEEERWFGDRKYYSVSIGWDGNLYLLEGVSVSGSIQTRIHVFDPITLTEKRTVLYPDGLATMAVSSTGMIYAIAHYGDKILQITPDGALLKSYPIKVTYLSPGNLQMDRKGRLIVGGSPITITNESLDSATVVPLGDTTDFSYVTSTIPGQ